MIMIDPLSIITMISTYATGYKAGGMISEWMNGKNIVHLQNGIEYLSKGVAAQNTDFLNKAIAELDYINTNDDKLFVVAYSYLCRSICYANLFNFTLAYDYLDKLDAIEYGFFTRKTDMIEDAKREGHNLRGEVKKLEETYNAYLNSLQESSMQSTNTNWKWIFISFAILTIIGVVILLFVL